MAAISLRFLVALALLFGFLGHQAAAQVTQPRYCSKSAFVNLSATAGTTQIAPSVNQAPFAVTPTIGGVAPLTGFYICGYVLIVGASTTVQFVYGFPASLPGTGCGASPTAFSLTYTASQTYIDTSSVARGFEVPSGNVVCVTTTGATVVAAVQIYYDNNPL